MNLARQERTVVGDSDRFAAIRSLGTPSAASSSARARTNWRTGVDGDLVIATKVERWVADIINGGAALFSNWYSQITIGRIFPLLVILGCCEFHPSTSTRCSGPQWDRYPQKWG